MSEHTVTQSTDQLPIVPETKPIEPIVQCGVLYLGTALPGPGRRGLDSVQEPLSHRYPVDGTNTARGIDSILSIYDNGIQLTFARQPHVVIFFPISSLVYCASLRFSVVENDQTSSIDWRFITIDSTIQNQSKHPPLFCAVVHRTQVLAGDECHCFITKNDDSALTLVRTISEVYAKMKPTTKPLRSPIFYQLDRYGRKISETNGIIYLSPATDDETQLNDYDGSISSIKRNYLLDPSIDGFFYRTDANIIEQWQLWDDDDLTGSRPRPPASPFGQHQGIYHDDLTQDIHHYLRQMDDEDRSSACSCSSSSSRYYRKHRHRRKSRHNTDQLDTSFSHSQASSFKPPSFSLQSNMEMTRSQQAPIIIEKVVPNTMMTIPQASPQYVLEQPQQSFNPPAPLQQKNVNYAPYSSNYEINEHGEKITPGGNRIVYMDVVQPNKTKEEHYITPTPRSRSHRRRSKHIPVIDLKSVENFIKIEKSKQRKKQKDDNDSEDNYLSTSDVLELVEGYFDDYKSKKVELNSDDAQAMLNHIATSPKKTKHRRSKSAYNNTHRESRSILTSGPTVNYVERPSIVSPFQQPNIPVLNTDQVNEYVANIYGTSEKTFESNESEHNNTEQFNNNAGVNENFPAAFRYMQSSVNPMLLREYRNAFTGI